MVGMSCAQGTGSRLLGRQVTSLFEEKSEVRDEPVWLLLCRVIAAGSPLGRPCRTTAVPDDLAGSPPRQGVRCSSVGGMGSSGSRDVEPGSAGAHTMMAGGHSGQGTGHVTTVVCVAPCVP